ncbi:hypothetical protein NUW58_g5883 [Xylaria curta]|uniref:Uncharacterized protein n=1 Tax=Xylaria curta TaxID=42375 RepID=A0ACC1P1P2_9PEZI|nr:hypothetical protein NUW58_g5883 [Xylaria curta]
MAVSLIVESAVWFAFTLLVVVARVGSRKVLLGSFKKFQADDYLMLLALGWDIVLLITLNILRNTNSNLIDPENPPILTPEEIADRTYGSKLVLVVEQSQCITIWLVKACLLFIFSKVQKICLKVLVAYVATSFVVMEILYLGVWCRPFNQYWAVPPDSVQCSAATNHLITNAVFNITSDIFIITIPMPIFLSINVTPKKKAVLCGVFALGFFTIGAAIANKYYSFTQPFGTDWTNWYVRESSTALIVANIPFLWTSLRFFFRLTSFSNTPASKSTNTKGGGQQVLSSFEPLKSQEDIKYYNDNIPLKIYKHQEIRITSEVSDGSETSRPGSKDEVSVKSTGR